MKKFSTIFKSSALFCGSALVAAAALSACSDEKDEPNPGTGDTDKVEAIDLDYSKENADSWHNYSVKVAELLARDSEDLYDSWTVSYEGGTAFADQFRNPSAASAYKSYVDCVDQIIEGCSDIASEVGDTKIGDPYNLFVSGKTTEALYAVESWYSWHSREDYQNNIYSVRNSYYGSLDGSVATHSLCNLVKSVDNGLNDKMIAAIDNAAASIYAIPQPFRNNINSPEASTAMEACANLYNLLDNDLKSLVNGLDVAYDAELKEIVLTYVEDVVLPTYKTLKERNAAMLTAIRNLATNRTDDAFKAACDSWLSAREPWERSEAFLFGPVDALGLDPNMDSWPLDQVAIVNQLKSGNFSELEWGDGDNDDKVEAAQNIRGFHTLEYLLFKNGQPRKVNN